LESNWRYDVYEEGLWGMNVALFAHGVSDINVGVSRNLLPSPFKGTLWVRPAPGQLWVPVLGINPAGNFPFGFEVTPDH
jgi:hypothetical protein